MKGYHINDRWNVALGPVGRLKKGSQRKKSTVEVLQYHAMLKFATESLKEAMNSSLVNQLNVEVESENGW